MDSMNPGRHASPLARQLLAAYVLLVIYASLHPFSGWRDPGIGTLEWLTAAAPRYITAFDVGANVGGYVPLGFLAVLALYPTARRGVAVGIAVAGAFLISLALESLQVYLPSRIASNVDLAANTAGGLLGALAGVAATRLLVREHGLHRLRDRTFRAGGAIDFGLVLLGLWMFSQLNPETLLYGNGDLRDLFALPDGRHYPAEVFIRFEAAVAAANVIAVGLLTTTLVERGQPGRLVLVMVLLASFVSRALAFALLFSPQDVLLWVTPGALIGVAIGTVAVLLAVALPRPARLALCGLALMAATAIVNFAPGNPYLMSSLAVWPQGQFLHFNGLTRLVSAAWPFTALAYLIWLAADRERRV
jgi:VanZ family protein